MRRRILIALACLMWGVGAFAAPGSSMGFFSAHAAGVTEPRDSFGQDTIKRDFSVSPGQQLTLNLRSGGAISLTTWDRNSVAVTATLGGRDGANCHVDMEQTSSGVEVTSSYRGSGRNYSTDIHLDIQTPRQFNLEVRSAGGSIAIAGLEGNINGRSGGGSLDITDSKGQIGLTTGGGSISVKNCALDGKVSTGGGSVMIESNTGNLKGWTGGGTVSYKGSTGVAGDTPGEKARVVTGGGNINLHDVPNGADVSTGGGSIHIESGRGHVKALTGGGSIVIGNLDGSVEATTGGGSINVTIVDQTPNVNHNVQIRTGSGDVTVTLPPGISADFDIELAYTQGSRRSYQITSDFALDQQTTAEWDYSAGSPRKYIRGKASLGGGQNRIVIRTVNGNVNIQRGQ